MSKTRIIALCLLGLAFIDLSSIFMDENYRRRDDEPVKYQSSNNFSYQNYSVVSTASLSPSPSIEST